MSAPDPSQVTRLLQRMASGDANAASELWPLVYDELHAYAERHMRAQRADHTLQPTALVNEAYLRLVDPDARSSWQSHAHFAAVAAKAMRSALVDHARRKQAKRRGEGAQRVELDDVVQLFEERVPDLLAFDETLGRLADMDEELARLVELRFFAGLSFEETARVLGVSEQTVQRHWRVARIWLKREMSA